MVTSSTIMCLQIEIGNTVLAAMSSQRITEEAAGAACSRESQEQPRPASSHRQVKRQAFCVKI